MLGEFSFYVGRFAFRVRCFAPAHCRLYVLRFAFSSIFDVSYYTTYVSSPHRFTVLRLRFRVQGLKFSVLSLTYAFRLPKTSVRHERSDKLHKHPIQNLLNSLHIFFGHVGAGGEAEALVE